MADTVLAQMYQRYKTASAWQSLNPVLAAGEWVIANDGGVLKAKVGDGARTWTQIDYSAIEGIEALIAAATAVSSVFGRTGAVTAQTGDYTADQIGETATRAFATPEELVALAALIALGDRPALALPTMSGLLSGGAMTAGAGTTQIDIAAGTGVIVDNTDPSAPAASPVAWGAKSNVSAIPGGIGADDATVYIGIDVNGDEVVQATVPTPAQRRSTIWLGAVLLAEDQTAVAERQDRPAVAYRAGELTEDYLRRAPLEKQGGGALSATGDVSGGFGLGLTVAALDLFGAGINWRADPADPNQLTVPAQDPVDLVYMLATGKVAGAVGNDIDPAEYEPVPGTLAPAVIGSESDPAWTNQAVFLTPAGLAIVLRGTEVYATKQEALDGIEAEDLARTVPDDLAELAVMAGWVTVRGDAAESDFGDLSDPTVAAFTTAHPKVRTIGTGGAAGGGGGWVSLDRTGNDNAGAPGWDHGVDGNTPFPINFINLGTYKDLQVVCQQIAADGTTSRVTRVSTDNGASYHANSGDYVSVAGSGAETARTSLGGPSGTGTGGLSWSVYVPAAGLSGNEKVNANEANDNVPRHFRASTLPINAVQVEALTASRNATGGKIWVLVRR